ncbi:Inositol phosphatase SIW14 [Sorochytrium milnesiophthora]
MSYASSVATLRLMRSTGEWNALKVAQHASVALASPSRLGDEVWAVLEQYVSALIDLGKVDEANARRFPLTAITPLDTKFPKSNRVRMLRAMVLESEGQFSEADHIYTDILKADNSNKSVFKRKVALLKGQNKTREAILALNAFLDTFPQDIEGWLELSALYTQTEQFQQAAFCLEEVLLLQPFNHLFHSKYAEALYTIGGGANIKKALKYFCRSIELVTDYMRGMYGAHRCTVTLLELAKNKDNQGELNAAYVKELEALRTVLGKRIIAIYETQTVKSGKDDPIMVQAVRQAMK